MRASSRPCALLTAVLATAALGTAGAAAATDPLLATATPAQPRILVWGDGGFVGRPAFEVWLRKHHESYRGWAATHPAGRSALALSTLPFGFRRSQLAPARGPAPPAVIAEPTAVTPPQPRFPLDLLLLALGGALIAVAASVPLIGARDSAYAYPLADRRLTIFMAGASILIGVGIGKLA